MKKAAIVLGVLLVCLVAIGFVVKQYFGDFFPAVLPHLSLTKYTPVHVTRGKALDVPLHVPDGYQTGIFVDGLNDLRDMTFSPGGLLLVSEPNTGKVLALPDRNNDGIADDAITVLSGLRRPHGLAFYNNKLYVAEETGVSRYIWAEQEAGGGQLAVARLDKPLFSLPEGGRHVTRTLAFAADGTLYVSLGSSCDVCVEKSPFLAAVIVSNADGASPKVFAKGLRNATFLTINPKTDQLWATEMGRDMLGDETPPDEIDILQAGGNYGWPYCYNDKTVDQTQTVPSVDFCNTTIPPIYPVPAHSAPLGLTFIDSPQFPADWQGDLFVSYHGSWNRSTPTGYKVVRLHVSGNMITGSEDFMTGFLQDGTAVGRPVDVIFDKVGNLYVSDDKAGKIYIVSKK